MVSMSTLKDLEKRIEKLENGSSKPTKEKKPRKPSEYNDFVGKFIPKYKKDNPDVSHKNAFAEAVKAWNLKNKKS
jgi:RNA processing factor Prp31